MSEEELAQLNDQWWREMGVPKPCPLCQAPQGVGPFAVLYEFFLEHGVPNREETDEA